MQKKKKKCQEQHQMQHCVVISRCLIKKEEKTHKSCLTFQAIRPILLCHNKFYVHLLWPLFSTMMFDKIHIKSKDNRAAWGQLLLNIEGIISVCYKLLMRRLKPGAELCAAGPTETMSAVSANKRRLPHSEPLMSPSESYCLCYFSRSGVWLSKLMCVHVY